MVTQSDGTYDAILTKKITVYISLCNNQTIRNRHGRHEDVAIDSSSHDPNFCIIIGNMLGIKPQAKRITPPAT